MDLFIPLYAQLHFTTRDNFVIVIYMDFAYNKSVIIEHKTPIKM